MKRAISLVIASILILLTVQPVCANSMPDIWYGEKGNMTMPMEEDCPIEVKQEILTFDVQEFPKEEYATSDEFLEYDGKVTAEYTFYNPTDSKITARLAFPFGGYPLIGENPETGEYTDDTKKYDICVNGEKVETNLRYTFSGYSDFEPFTDKQKLNNEFKTDRFYYPEMPVTKYTYDIGKTEVPWIDLDVRAIMKFDPERTKIFTVMGQYAWDNEDGTYELAVFDSYQVDDNAGKKTVSIYVIGDALKDEIEWQFYNMEEEVMVEGATAFVKKEIVTLEELVFMEFDEDSGITKEDWYNAYIEFLKEGEWDKGSTGWGEFGDEMSLLELLMRWYEYEITLEPGETIVNTVTAPIYPTIDLDSRNAANYEYMYLLSPAKLWSDFGSLEIRINTPYYIVSKNKKEFEKTDSGYVLKREGLPDEELTFSLSEDENLKLTRGFYMDINDLLFIVVWLSRLLIVVAIIVVLWKWIKRKSRRKMKD